MTYTDETVIDLTVVNAEIRADDLTVPLRPLRLTIATEYETFYTDQPVRLPDDRWHLRHDGCFHVHRWLTVEENVRHTGAEKPRMVWFAERMHRHVECDGSCGMQDCGGYEVQWWRCPVTDTEIVPDTVAGPQHATLRGVTTVEVACEALTGFTGVLLADEPGSVTLRASSGEDPAQVAEWVITRPRIGGDVVYETGRPVELNLYGVLRAPDQTHAKS